MQYPFRNVQPASADQAGASPVSSDGPIGGTLFEAFKAMQVIEMVLIILIIVIVGLCLLFFILAILRRIYNARKYARLDRLRSRQMSILHDYMENHSVQKKSLRRYASRPNTLQWQATEDNLFSLLAADATHDTAYRLFDELGYVDHYMQVLKGHKVIARAAAVTKLGRIGNPRAGKAILAMLNTGHHELVAAAVRAVCKLQDAPGISTLLSQLPDLLQQRLITPKNVDASLVASGPGIVPILLMHGKTCRDPRLIASLLTVFNDFPASRDICDFAVSYLEHSDAEVRAKAAKLMTHCEEKLCFQCDVEIKPLLKDPVWFVRLQAVRSLGHRRQKENAEALAALVLDERWQVRNEAALALTLLGKDAVDAFLRLLKSNDHYAKESVCEEIERADFVDVLLEMLGSPEASDADRAREILKIMALLGFVSPMRNYLAGPADPVQTSAVKAILREATA